MKCIIRNISAGVINAPQLQLGVNEEKKVDFTEKLRHYISLGYIKMVELCTDEELMIKKVTSEKPIVKPEKKFKK